MYATPTPSLTAIITQVQLNRDLIIATALELLDSYGLGDTTMRRVATTLGVAPGALYWHVANKQSLIAAMSDHIVGDLLPSSSPSELALALRKNVLAHRDGAEVTMAGLSQPGNPSWPALVDRFAAAVAASASDDADAYPSAVPTSRHRIAATAIIHLTLGAATMEQSAQQLASVATAGGATETTETTETIDATEVASAVMDGVEELRAGVDIIVRGLAAAEA